MKIIRITVSVIRGNSAQPGVFQPGEENAHGDLTSVLKYLMEGLKKMEPDSSSGPEQPALVNSALNR